MQIVIEDIRIRIGDDCVRYYPYYIDIWGKYKQTDRLTVVKSVIVQWARSLMKQGVQGMPVYLPYSLDDEAVECFRATRRGDTIVFRCVVVYDNGYALELDHLDDFVFAVAPKILQEYPKDFGEYNAQELIEGLMNPQLGTA